MARSRILYTTGVSLLYVLATSVRAAPIQTTSSKVSSNNVEKAASENKKKKHQNREREGYGASSQAAAVATLLESETQCGSFISCGSCVGATISCSWCATYGICLPGYEGGPTACPSLYSGRHATCDDTALCYSGGASCGECTAIQSGNCGYCPTSQKCLPKSPDGMGPLQGECSFGWTTRWDQCKSPQMNEVSPSSCHGCLNPLGIFQAGELNQVVWCTDFDQCTPGNSSGPFSGEFNCGSYEHNVARCDAQPSNSGCGARSYTSCETCTAEEGCAWCVESSLCTENSYSCSSEGITTCSCTGLTSCQCTDNNACAWCPSTASCVYSPSVVAPVNVGPWSAACPGLNFVYSNDDESNDCNNYPDTDLCQQLDTCSDCINNAENHNCGWCQGFGGNGVCRSGDLQGPGGTFSNCDGSWSVSVHQCTTSSDPASCSQFTTCSGCLNLNGCGWCANTKYCLPGNGEGPADPSVCTASNWVHGFCDDVEK